MVCICVMCVQVICAMFGICGICGCGCVLYVWYVCGAYVMSVCGVVCAGVREGVILSGESKDSPVEHLFPVSQGSGGHRPAWHVL